MTEEEKSILINEIVDYLISNSQSVEGIPIIESLDGVSSFPAIKDHINEESDVVRISINSILPEFRFINGRIQYKFTDREWIDLFTVSSAMSNYATDDYVILKIGEVIDDAPATMNTLNKIAAALNYDYDFYKNIYQAINSKWTKNDAKIANWDASYSWGDHRLAGNVKTISVNNGEASFPDSEGNANIIVPITEIDEALDAQSTNPVQNKVIKEALVQMDTRFATGMNIDTETNILSLLDAVGNVLGTAQLPSGGGGTTEPGEEVDGSTLGELTNVNNEVNVQDAQDVFLVKSAGSDEWGKRNVKDFTGKDGVIAYPTMFLNPLTGRLILQVPTNNYENRFAVENGRLILKQ